MICSNGSCITCSSGTTPCGGAACCSSTETCCGRACCPSGQTCSNGSCVSNCPSGETPCGTTCCPVGQICSTNGTCTPNPCGTQTVCESGLNNIICCDPVASPICCKSSISSACYPSGYTCCITAQGLITGCAPGTYCCDGSPYNVGPSVVPQTIRAAFIARLDMDAVDLSAR